MIGIFDSGIGGLTTVRAILEIMPGYDLIYFGDTARTPYGTKSRSTVIRYAIENTEFLIKKGATMIVMACNTASSVATEAIKERFDMPIFEVISPAVALAIETSKRMQIGVIGTRGTIKSGIYEKKILEKADQARVFSTPCPLLVPLVEEGWVKKPETAMIVKKYLLPLKTRQIDTLILGCTHYPILKSIIQQKIGRRVAIIDSSIAVSNTIKTYLDDHPDIEKTLSKEGRAFFFVSDITTQFEKTAEIALKRKIDLTHVEM
ncbi:MAG: glutamate racemase [Proteobacteria bacterium]|nr:glutamate racemase [Pseudomonadota bacterium]